MKKNLYKILSVLMCSVVLSFTLLTSSLNVKSYCDVNAVEWLHDNFNDAVSAIGGAVINTTVDCWNAWKTLLGLNDQEFNDFITNGVSVGGDGNVSISDDVADSIKDFVDDYKNNLEDFKYCYSCDFRRWSNAFVSRQRYQSILNLLNANPNSLFIFHSYYGVNSDPNSNDDNNSVQQGGNLALHIYKIDNTFSCFVLNGITTGFFSVNAYNDDWQKLKWGNTTCYGFAHSGDLTLSEIDLPSINESGFDMQPLDADKNAYPLNGSNYWTPHANTYFLIHSSPHAYPMYRTTDIMKQYSLGNQPYYVVPPNPNITSVNGSYNMTQTQLDNSISYGDISSYVESNNVTEYSTVVNYINNYYGSGSGGSGSGGSGSGGSGSDVDWSWLGKIGEVIGGLISALGNVLSGIIEGVADLITSLTEKLPNLFGSCVEWLLPFLPEEVTALLGTMILAIIIVGVIRLIRGK